MSRLTRDGTAEPVSRDQILRHARGQGNIIFPVQLTTNRIGNLTRLIHTLLYVMTIHTYIHTYTLELFSKDSLEKYDCYFLFIFIENSHIFFCPLLFVVKLNGLGRTELSKNYKIKLESESKKRFQNRPKKVIGLEKRLECCPKVKKSERI